MLGLWAGDSQGAFMDDAVYDQIADLERTHWWFVARRRILRTLIDRYAPATNGRRPTLCDIGCGAGEMMRVMSDRFDVTGVDTSTRSREICARAGITVHDGTLPDQLPFAEASFDVVIVADVLEHVEEDAASVRALARLTRPGGIVVATVPAHAWMWGKHDEAAHHKRRYTRESLRRLFETPEGLFRREVLSYFNTVLFGPIAGARLMGRMRKDAEGSDIRPVAEPLNSVLRWGFGLERHLVGRVPMPTGVSLLAVYRRV